MASLGYYKLGTDVYENLGGGQSQKIDEPTFQTLGINYNLLGEGLPMTKTLDQVRDTETKNYVQAGGQLGQASAAANAGYTANYTPTPPPQIPSNVPVSSFDSATGLTQSDTSLAWQNKIAENMANQNTLLTQALAVEPVFVTV